MSMPLVILMGFMNPRTLMMFVLSSNPLIPHISSNSQARLTILLFFLRH